MDVVDDRAGVRSTVIASQLPVSDWHHLIVDPSIADAVLDRLVHRSVRDRAHGRVDAQENAEQGERVDLKPNSTSTLARQTRRFAPRCSA